MRTSSRSRFRRTVEWIRSLWRELDHAQRRLLETQTGVPMGKGRAGRPDTRRRSA
jgi:hypothetical protein